MEPFDKSPRRIEFLYQWVLVFAVLLFFIAPSFILYQWATGPVRELNRVPGVTMVPVVRGEPDGRFDVGQIEFRDTVVTADVLRPALEFPFLTGAFFYSCRIEGDVAAVLADCDSLKAVAFIDCHLGVGRLVSECAESKTLEVISFRRVPLSPGDFRDFGRWHQVRRIVLAGIPIDGDDLRDIAKAATIRELIFEETTISDDVVSSLVDVDIFESVHLEFTNLTDSQVANLCRCTRLKFLDIGQTDVTEAALQHLAKSSSLKKVYAVGTPLGEGYQEKHLPNGCIVYGSGENQMPRNP